MKSHFPWHLRPLAPSCSVSATAVFFPGKKKEGGPPAPPQPKNQILQSQEERMMTRQLHLEGDGGAQTGAVRKPGKEVAVWRSQVDRLGVPSFSSSMKQVECVYGVVLLAPFCQRSQHSSYSLQILYSVLPWSALDPMPTGKENNNIG